MNVFNEDTRVKIPATVQVLRLGYDYQSMKEAEIDFDTKVFISRFKSSLERINNRDFSDEEISDILTDIHNMIKNNDLGKEFYMWLIKPLDRVKLIDFDNVDNNDFAVVDELPFSIDENTEKGSFRPDINILINGMPLAFLEVKIPDNDGGIQAEFNRMINQRLVNPDWRKFFNLIQIVSFSNNMEYEEADDAEDVKAGSFYTTPNGNNTSFSFFREDSADYHNNYPYKEISEDYIKEITVDLGYSAAEVDTVEFQKNLELTTPCNRFITSLFDKERLLYFLKYGMMFIKDTVPQKHIMRYPQFFASRKIIERLESGGKGGIIWHTQGSGKTGLSAFCVRVINDYYDKKNISARFFFVVDRLDLLRQASVEFQNRNLSVVNCDSRESFTRELNRPLSKSRTGDTLGEICVVNIHKFEDRMPEAKNDYNANIQRIFFIDEAHRSYSSTGEFFKNLMTCDLDAVYIALTGTPLLTKKERSSLKFGDYIHKYFYDKSIADGYTLRIKKEQIDTVAKADIKKNLDIEDNKLEEREVYESEVFCANLGEFIQRDFENFRLQNSDPTIGGMVVCRTNPQARQLHKWFEDNSRLVTGLVITDESDPKQALANKNNQINFHDTLKPDLLIVNLMLTTGYDVKRLKKMYLLREPHAQNLLQTISRVNRPYKSPNGRVYKYGYIVDFIDIEEEYNTTIENYIKELEAEINENGEDEASLEGLVIDKEDINRKYHRYVSELESIIPTDNLEVFSQKLEQFTKETLLKIRRLLNGIKECYTEFVLSRAVDYAKQIDRDRIRKLLKLTQNRINFVNLKSKPAGMMDVISDKEIVEIIYEFVKVKISILDLGKLAEDNPEVKDFTDVVKEVQREIKNNKNKGDIKVMKLDELLQRVFDKLSISDLSDIGELTDELREALVRAREINAENDRLAALYGNNYAFVKTYQDACADFTGATPSDIETVLHLVYDAVKDNLDREVIIVQGRRNFVDEVKSKITKQLLKQKLYKSVKSYYDKLLNELYTNLQLFK